MSYLPRMSKTYKEPQQNLPEALEEISSNVALKPASCLLAEGTHNPQIALKHYRYLPHPLPVLPGPSLFDEVEENELQKEAIRLKRSSSIMETQSKINEELFENLVSETKEATSSVVSPEEVFEKSLSLQTNKKLVRSSKSNSERKKSGKITKKEKSEFEINVCAVGDTSKTYLDAQYKLNNQGNILDSEFPDKEEVNLSEGENSKDDSLENIKKRKGKETRSYETSLLEFIPNERANRGTQCTIFGNAEKKFVIPHVSHCLLRSLAFLLRELHRLDVLKSVSGERRTLMTQIQLILGDLCNQKIGREYGFDVTYSDSKRLEKILKDLQKYVKDIYGDKEECLDKLEDLKKVFVDLKRKEMELDILKNKLKELEGQTQPELILKESDLRNPEITLQNKRLESEQLLAEVEFSFRESVNCQKSIAEIDWDIKTSHEQIAILKKTASRSKSDVLGRGGSLCKFSTEIMAKGSKSKENDIQIKKKHDFIQFV